MSHGLLRAPWTQEQVDALNRFQRREDFHPFTCGGDRCDDAHKKYADDNNLSAYGILQATPDGWVCPVCGYKQDWAHSAMVKFGGSQ